MQKKTLIISNSNKQNELIRENLFWYLKEKKISPTFVGAGNCGDDFDYINWVYANKRSIIYSLFCFFSLILIIIQNKPTHIISFAPKANLFCQLISKIISFKHCLVITGFGESVKFLVKNNLSQKLFFKFLDSKNTIWVTLNEKDMKLLNDYRISPNNIFKIPGEGYVSKFIDNQYLNRNRKYDLIYMGRILESKGIFRFLECVSNLKKIDKNFKVCIIGEMFLSKTKKHDFYLKIKSLNVDYLGYVCENEKNKILLNSKVLVMPSEYGEGLPFILLEAQDAGCNVVVTKNPACLQTLSVENCDLVSESIPELISDMVLKAIEKFNRSSPKTLNETRYWINYNFSSNTIIKKYDLIFKLSNYLN